MNNELGPNTPGANRPTKLYSSPSAIIGSDGSFRLFRVFGIDVFMNWTWFVVAYFQISYHPLQYTTPVWKVVEYLTLFAIVLLHEFGHALACRSVGGTADRIMLWPLGGVAYVNPPPRAGAYLWSIVAGPLVNVVLVPITLGLLTLTAMVNGGEPTADVHQFFLSVAWVNVLLLVFNLLPIYPLDGGQIVRALLWFAIGPARSLMVVAVFGVILGGGALVMALLFHQWWLSALAVFAVFRSVSGIASARSMIRLLKVPRRVGLACPSCGAPPPQGDFWVCNHCRRQFDTFLQRGRCPNCGTESAATQCHACGQQHPIAYWFPLVAQVATSDPAAENPTV